MIDAIWRFIQLLWQKDARVSAVVVAVVVLLFLVEGAQCNLFGESAYRIASRVLPWHSICQQRASLDVGFNIQRLGSGTLGPLTLGAKCPVGSNISFSFTRSRSGWISGFWITEGFGQESNDRAPYPLLDNNLAALPYKGKEWYSGRTVVIESGEGMELFVFVGADKPFDPQDEIIPAMRRLKFDASKGGRTLLAWL